MYKTGVVRDLIYIEHDMGPYHPESPKRLISIYDMLDKPDMAGKFIRVPVREATKEEICRIHNESYFRRIEATKGTHANLDPDTSTSPMSYEAALKAAGGPLNALDMIFKSEIHNAFAIVRPPGHHAEANTSRGFCIFNNIAIAAEYAMRNLGCKKVAIVDWDLHHGNGTQNSFYGTDRVFYLSTHQSPFFPGSGDWTEVGWKEGEGFTFNIPLYPGYGTGDYCAIYEKIFKPALIEYNPDLLLISAGFDIYYQDPIGGMQVHPEGFEGLLNILMEVAETCCDGKFMIFLEGGYNVEGETEGVRRCLELMAKPAGDRPTFSFTPEHEESIEEIRAHVRSIQGNYWKTI
jgi:acetoin utilization deacetylase AcuC-like enzyme